MSWADGHLDEALTLSLGDNDRFMLSDLLEEHDALEARIASYCSAADRALIARRAEEAGMNFSRFMVA